MYSQSFALPLHLISFDARDEGNRVHLFWKVASEMPDIRFELQSSSDARQWSLCSVETVSNRVTDGVKFSAYDLKPLKDIKYYRIRQIDADGAEAFSRTIAVRAGADLDFIKISPNPIVGNQLRIEGFENIEDWRIDAVNMSGQSILILPTGKATISLPNLRSGVYALRFTSKSTGEVRTLTFSRE
jgi:hypothetical protein